MKDTGYIIAAYKTLKFLCRIKSLLWHLRARTADGVLISYSIEFDSKTELIWYKRDPKGLGSPMVNSPASGEFPLDVTCGIQQTNLCRIVTVMILLLLVLFITIVIMWKRRGFRIALSFFFIAQRSTRGSRDCRSQTASGAVSHTLLTRAHKFS